MNTYIKTKKGKGRCVFALRDLKKDEEIEINHVIVYRFLPNKHDLLEWSMYWDNKRDAIALGHLNLLSHSEDKNCYLINDYKNLVKVLYAARDIRRGEELTIDYACDLWFKVVDKKKKAKDIEFCKFCKKEE